jgi:hypothetical protein
VATPTALREGCEVIAMHTSAQTLTQLAQSFANVIIVVDKDAQHDRWKAGIGSF